MYDFHFDTKKKILKDQENFLIFVKKLLPRWLNGIPDSECLAIFRILQKRKKRKNTVALETGCGASTLALFLHCCLNKTKFFSWDTNGSKGSYLRTIINESICQPLNVNVNDVWSFIPYYSTDKYAGIQILKELNLKSDFGFFDSSHTLSQVKSEIREFEKISSNEFYIALDDAYYNKKNVNFTFLNIIRTKLKLKRVKEPLNNICLPFYEEVQKYLSSKYKKVLKVDDYYKKNFNKDDWFNYYKEVKDFGISSYDKKFSKKDFSSKKSKMFHRFDAFLVKK
ncbi:MAG: hypothetical protein ISQ92_00520 [Pelagibacteraceae bacterium]|jgi:hypothetical protein|nr:hypothetical protein [Pelagibacteraceae bacterium]